MVEMEKCYEVVARDGGVVCANAKRLIIVVERTGGTQKDCMRC